MHWGGGGTHNTYRTRHAGRRTRYASHDTAGEAQETTRETMTGTSEKARTKPCQEEHRTPCTRHRSGKQGARGWVRACETRAREGGYKHARYYVRHLVLGGETKDKTTRSKQGRAKMQYKVYGVPTCRALRRKHGAR